MSPKIYEYKGISLRFFSNEHDPIHVHATTTDGRECRVSFHLRESEIAKVSFDDVKGKKPLTLSQMKKLKDLVKHEKQNIVNAWIKVIVLKDTVVLTKITKTIK
jgi:hypothetical protein